jgi:hypothetical protein
MLRKWYIELPLVLLTIVISVMFVWRLDIDTSSPAAPVTEQPITNPVNSPATKPNEEISEGKSLFKINCASCHNPVVDGTGPPLAGVSERWKAAGKYRGKDGEQWLRLWIHNWHEPVDAGYPYARTMANSRASEMNIFSDLSEEKINKILLYLNSPPQVNIKPVASLR